MRQILACSIVVFVVYFTYTSARPLADENTNNSITDEDIEKILRIPLINAHVR